MKKKCKNEDIEIERRKINLYPKSCPVFCYTLALHCYFRYLFHVGQKHLNAIDSFTIYNILRLEVLPSMP